MEEWDGMIFRGGRGIEKGNGMKRARGEEEEEGKKMGRREPEGRNRRGKEMG